MREESTTPNERFEALRLLKVFPKTDEGTVPTIFEALILLKVFP